jgi:preprotein translocase subunit YajC
MWFEGTAWAATPAPAPQGMFDVLLTNPIVPLVLVVAVFYFLILRPQTQRANEHQKMLKALKRNDEVVTTGGLIGRINEIGDNLVTLEIAPNVRVRVERAQISGLSTHGKSLSKKDKSD